MRRGKPDRRRAGPGGPPARGRGAKADRGPAGKGAGKAADKAGGGGEAPAARPAARPSDGGASPIWGRRAVEAALANPERRIARLLCAGGGAGALRAMLERLPPGRRAALPAPEAMEPRDFARALPPGAVHQGVAAWARPPRAPPLEAFLEKTAEVPDLLLVVLDLVTDPQNVGAIARSAAAYGAAAVVLRGRGAPPADGALAKAASGALERVALIETGNLARALDLLGRAGVWRVGLAGEAADGIESAGLGGRTALVLGAEGAGLRRLTRERCDRLVRLPTDPAFASLNVSNAAAIALHEARRAAREAAPAEIAAGRRRE